MQDPPGDFIVYDRSSPLTDPWRPLFARARDERLTIGLVVRPEHTNSRGTPHGGLIAALADNAMGIYCGLELRAKGREVKSLWTTSLSVDYLGRAEIGQWLTFETTYTRTGRSACYAEADIAADGVTVGRARAAFRAAT
jgi:uncharacterized protein (TIGR00369 family)